MIAVVLLESCDSKAKSLVFLEREMVLMLRSFTVAALATIGLLMTAPRAGAGVLLDDVKAIVAGNPVAATAFHGFISGTDANGGGNPLLQYLNSGTNVGETLTLLAGAHVPAGTSFTISSLGMFGSNNTGLPVPPLPTLPVIDVVEFQPGFGGFNPAQPWQFVGKTNFAGDGSAVELPTDPTSPFASSAGGVLTLNNPPLSAGSYALSLKTGNRYAVYLFQNVGAISSFMYGLEDISPSERRDLSHATLYRTGGVVPEPTSLAVFGFGALLGVGGLVRRRFELRKGFAAKGLAT